MSEVIKFPGYKILDNAERIRRTCLTDSGVILKMECGHSFKGESTLTYPWRRTTKIMSMEWYKESFFIEYGVIS